MPSVAAKAFAAGGFLRCQFFDTPLLDQISTANASGLQLAFSGQPSDVAHRAAAPLGSGLAGDHGFALVGDCVSHAKKIAFAAPNGNGEGVASNRGGRRT